MQRDDPLMRSLELLNGARRGERSNLDDLVRLHRDSLLDRIRLMMGERARSVAESGDFLHETLIQAARALGRFQPDDEAHLLRWLTEIARNRIRDAVRRPRETALARLSDSIDLRRERRQSAPPSILSEREALHELADALGSLRPEERQAVELRHFEGLGFRAIGERMGRSENAAQLLHGRALLRLGRMLQR